MKSYSALAKISCGPVASLLDDLQTSHYPVLILTSPTVSKIPDILALVSGLRAKYDGVEVFDRIEPNATFSCIDRAILAGTTLQPKTIIAIGGGSVIDAAKAIAMTLSSKISYREFFGQSKVPPPRTIQLIAVPTTAGTGAELSFGGILQDDANNIKSGIRGETLQPDTVLLDVTLYSYAPHRLIAEVGFDCLTHAVETYISTASSPIVRYQSVHAIRTVLTYLRLAFRKDGQALQMMAIASSLMGLNLAYSTTCLPHRIQYVIGPETSTSHAQGLIALYQGWLSVISAGKSGPFVDLCNDLMTTPKQFIESIQSLKRDLSIGYTLAQFGVTLEDVPRLAVSVKGNLSNDPYFNDIHTIETILKESL